MEGYQTILFSILTDAMIAICILGAVLLFLRGKNNRARRMLGYTMLLWGLSCVGRVVCIHMGDLPLLFHPFRIVGLLGGNLFIVFILFFPLEVVLPGWLNAKRLILLLLPVFMTGLLYFAGLAVLQQPMENLVSFSQFLASLGRFNVWFRILFLILSFFYIFLFLRLIYRYEKKYIKWKNDNFADVDYMDISWMRYYVMFILAIFIAWLLNIFIACQTCYIIHTEVTLFSFSFFLYKGLFHESAYPADFFGNAGGNVENLTYPEHVDLLPETTVLTDEVTDASFKSKMPFYLESLKSWMEQERPYLYKDFKLTDVGRQLPLNRSYLSRLFNEGFGKNFSEVVRSYRVEYAKVILEQHPEFSLQTVAGLCGFSSDSTFIRAFRTLTGMTPSQYRSGRYNK